MNPIDFIHKADLGSNLDYFIDELNYFSSVVNQLNPKTIDCDFWCISDHGGVTFISHKNYPEIETLTPIEDAKWNNVAKFTPRLNDFFDRFNLHRYIGKIHSEVWPIHRHVFNASTQWSLTVFDGDVDDSKMHFYEANDDSKFSDTDVYDVMSFYNRPLPNFTQTIFRKDIYTFRTWVWHSYEINKPANVFLLYPKNLIDADSATNYISSLKHL